MAASSVVFGQMSQRFMLRYLTTRLLYMVPVIWLVVSVVFCRGPHPFAVFAKGWDSIHFASQASGSNTGNRA
jgi:hypothetical protein